MTELFHDYYQSTISSRIWKFQKWQLHPTLSTAIHPFLPPSNIYNKVYCNIHTTASNIPFFFYEKLSPLSPAASQSQNHQFWWHFLKRNVIQNALPPSIQSRPLMAVERAGYFIRIIPDPNYIFSPPEIPANCAQ